jgi:hypothetical protein
MGALDEEAMRKKNAHEDFPDETLLMLKRAATPEAKRARLGMQETLTHLASLDADDAQWFRKDAWWPRHNVRSWIWKPRKFA